MAKVLSDSSSGTFAGDSDNLDAFAALVERHLTSDVAFSTDVGDTYTISGLAAGYYLVKDQDSSLGAAEQPAAYTKFMLQMVKDINATPKSDLPTVEKKVHESSYATDGGYGTGYNDVADWSFGDKVPFKLIGTVPEMDGYSAYKYTFHDTLSAGLTLDSTSVKVYLAGAKDADLSSLTPLTADSDYTLNLPSSSGTALIDGCSFEIAFTNLAGIAGIASGKYIIVTYDATLNDTAMIGLNGNENTVKLEFSNNPADSTDTDETTPDTVIVFTYELDGTKVDGADTDTTLPGAEFVLLNAAKNKVAQIGDDGKLDGWTDLPGGAGTGNAITYEDWADMDPGVILTSDANGLFKAIGLDDGTYQLREIKAPAGYNLLPGDVEIVITADTANGQSWTGTPAAALAVGAGVVLVAKRRAGGDR